MMNGDDDNVTKSDSPSPVVQEAGCSSRSSSPDRSNFASPFARSSARKSLGNGLSVQKWFFAQEKVMGQYEVSIACFVFIQLLCYFVVVQSSSSDKLRHYSVLLNRLRIGHSRLTHSFLFSDDDLPECGTCQCPLTVKHILVECVDLNDVQNKHFVASSIKALFDNIEAHKIIDFIKETRFHKQL